jgi:two-component system phosphate regulon response regulator PhoB
MAGCRQEKTMRRHGDPGPSSGSAAGPTVKPLILLVEEEPDLTSALAERLADEGFRAVRANIAQDAAASAERLAPHLLLIDLKRSPATGIDLCRSLREGRGTRDLGIILLSPPDGETDGEGTRVEALQAGADLYVTKPFSSLELVARIRAMVRRVLPDETDTSALQFADVHMDLVAHRVRRNGRFVHLGPTEYRLLRHFLEQPGRVISRAQLLRAVWGAGVHVEPRTVDVHVRRLRMALNGTQDPDIIQTIRSVGYSLALPKGQRG